MQTAAADTKVVTNTEPQLAKELGLFSATSIVAGMVGSVIFIRFG